jgi:hypothetical protein
LGSLFQILINFFCKILQIYTKKAQKFPKIASKASSIVDKSFTLPKTQLRKFWLNLFFLEKCKRVQVILFFYIEGVQNKQLSCVMSALRRDQKIKIKIKT